MDGGIRFGDFPFDSHLFPDFIYDAYPIDEGDLEPITRGDRILGCLSCGAYGDAFGYTVEFMSESEIVEEFGEKGLRKPILSDGKMRFSDDTQMTLVAANAIIFRQVRWEVRGIAAMPNEIAYRGYRVWAANMFGSSDPGSLTEAPLWVLKVPEINANRAPGNTCMSRLLHHPEPGTVEERANDSKGCGGVMRVAPYGLAYPLEHAVRFAIDDAASTHGHELGWLTAGAFAGIIANIMEGKQLEESIKETVSFMDLLYGGYPHWDELRELLLDTIQAARQSVQEDRFDIGRFGEGWVAEEALSMALYACLCFGSDVHKVLRFSINHGGDSDSVASIAGNICGALFGHEFISWTLDFSDLERYDVIRRISEDLAGSYDKSEGWKSSYIDGELPPGILRHRMANGPKHPPRYFWLLRDLNCKTITFECSLK